MKRLSITSTTGPGGHGTRRACRRLAAAVVVVLLLCSCAGAPRQADDPVSDSGRGVRVGSGTATLVPVGDRRRAPELRGVTLDGAALNVADLRGDVVVLNVWGSWCAPCKKEQPDLRRAAETLAADGVKFVGINVRDRTPGNALVHYRRYGVTYPSLFDPSAKLVAQFRDLPPSAIPSTVVLDSEGRVAARVIGATSYDELVDLVRRVL